MDGGGLAELVAALLGLAVAVVLAVTAVFVGGYFLLGVAINFVVRLLIAWRYRADPIPGRQLLAVALVFGILVLLVTASASLYPEGWRFLATVGFFIALAGYYRGFFLYEMDFESEAVMKAEQEIIAAEITIWAQTLWYRARLLGLAIVSVLMRARGAWKDTSRTFMIAVARQWRQAIDRWLAMMEADVSSNTRVERP